MENNFSRMILQLIILYMTVGFQSHLGKCKQNILSKGKFATSNAFDSPCVIKRRNRDESMNDPFESPSAFINGGTEPGKSRHIILFFL